MYPGVLSVLCICFARAGLEVCFCGLHSPFPHIYQEQLWSEPLFRVAAHQQIRNFNYPHLTLLLTIMFTVCIRGLVLYPEPSKKVFSMFQVDTNN